ncbi:MAG: TIGR03618 family F420-dependent PPOX class oxidoreductase [Dehalococcoidia bacterium]
MPLSDQAFEQLMSEPLIVVFGTIGPTGAPHQAPVWFEWRDGAILIPTERGSQKWRNIERDPRVSVCIERREGPMAVALVSGTAEILDTDYSQYRARFYERYYGDEAEARLAANPTTPGQWALARITPSKVITFGAG